MSKTIKTGGFRHGMHALITLFTCGLWAPFWFFGWLFSNKKTKIKVQG